MTNFTLWYSKSSHDGLNQTQNVERTCTHAGKEKHDSNAATKLRTQSSTDHVWESKLKNKMFRKWTGFKIILENYTTKKKS